MREMKHAVEEKEMPLVSIIIPIYRTEPYLAECIDSVLKQDYQNLEIILIDDGSTDRCPFLCDQYAQKYEKVQVVHQQNQGLGTSRNVGMSLAKGTFLMFLDSDDCLDGNQAVRRLVEKAEEEQADIVTGNFRRFNSQRISRVNRHHLRGGSYTRTVEFRFRGFLTDNHLITDWGKLYRASFLKRHHLKCNVYHFMEDKQRNMVCCTYEPVYGFIDESVYLYRITEGSITDQYRKNVEDMAEAWVYVGENFYHFLKERDLLESYGDLLAFHMFCGVFSIGRQSLRSGKKRGKATVELLKKYRHYPLVHSTISELVKGKYIREVHLLFWKFLVRMASVLFYLKAYWLLVCGIALLQCLGTENRMSRLRYKRQGEKQ